MTWTAPKTWATNELLTADDMNEQVSGNLGHLGGYTIDGTDLSSYSAATNLAKVIRRATYPIGKHSPLFQVADEVLGGETIWLRADGRTVGNAASSGADVADDTMIDLFAKLWDESTNTELVIEDSTGTPTTRGASAAADWAANKRMPTTDLRGRLISGMDDPTGADAADRVTDAAADILADSMGAETHTLTTAQLAAHTHSVPSALNSQRFGAGADAAGTPAGSTGSAGSGDAHNNMQPTMFLHYFISTGN